MKKQVNSYMRVLLSVTNGNRDELLERREHLTDRYVNVWCVCMCVTCGWSFITVVLCRNNHRLSIRRCFK